MSEQPRNKIWMAVALVAGMQLAALVWMIAGRISLLKSGREMTVEVVPVDPRDLFRGEYVILGYTFSGTGDTSLPDATKRGDRLYATLKAAEGTKWDLVTVTPSYPEKLEPGQAVLSGYASDVWRNSENGRVTGRIRYGIETYFVPEGKGRAIEEMVRDKKIEALLAVSGSGQAAIKALVIDGKRVHEEPLY
ncbi:MAG: GDYXXLXY domain-containing protein [Hyphomicrobium sp.]